MKYSIVCIFVLSIISSASSGITFEPITNLNDVHIDTVEVEDTTYHTIKVEGFPFPLSGEYTAGFPSVPFFAQTFLLPPDVGIDTLLITSTVWDTLPG